MDLGGKQDMKFMSWSLNAPSSSAFNRYIQKIDDEWKVVDPNGINTTLDFMSLELGKMEIYTTIEQQV